MTSQPSPTYNFPGISYNPTYFNSKTSSSSSGLTQTQANALYLQKTVADTATGVETFTSGTKSSNYDVVTPSSVMLIGPSQTSLFMAIGCADSRSGNITLASGATQSANVNLCVGATNTGEVRIANDPTNAGAIRIGDNGLGATGANITIGSTTMPTTMNGNTTIANLKTTSVESTAVGNVFNLATTQTTGILNIGTATRTGAGVINIGTLSQAAINIGTGSVAGFNTITIGGSNTGTQIAGTLAVTQSISTPGSLDVTSTLTASGGIVASTIGPSAVSDAMNIASAQTTGILSIGNAVRTGVGAINIGKFS